MRNAAGNILLLLISILFSLVAAEFMVRLVAPQTLYGSLKQESKTGGYWVNKESGDALTLQHEGGSILYRYGKNHLRIGPAQSEAPNKVLVLGDSFTFGFHLNWEDTYVARLQRFADKAFGAGKIQFLNAGTTYWGTADYAAFYEDYGKDFDIKTVLVFLNTDDIGRSVLSGIFKLNERTGALERPPNPPLAGRRLKYVMNSIPFYEYMMERSHLLAVLRSAVTQTHVGPPPESLVSQWENGIAIPRSLPDAASAKHAVVIAKRLFERMSRLAGERHHRLIVLTTGWHKFGHPNASEPTAAFMGVAEEFFKDRGIEFVDLSDNVYRRANGTLATLVNPGGHPNEAGAGLIAEAAWEILSKKLP